MLTWLIVAVAALGLLGLLGLAAAPLGLLQGPPPTDLGVKDGGLKAPSTGPNSVSGQAARFAGHPMQQATMIAPLPLTGDAATAMARLRAVVASQPARRGAARRGDDRYARFTIRQPPSVVLRAKRDIKPRLCARDVVENPRDAYRHRCGFRQGQEALAIARHKQSSGLFVSGLSLATAANPSVFLSRAQRAAPH